MLSSVASIALLTLAATQVAGQQTVLNDGSSYKTGYIRSDLIWQASGTLIQRPDYCAASTIGTGSAHLHGSTGQTCFRIDLPNAGSTLPSSANEPVMRRAFDNSTALDRAMANDLDLEAYFEAFPEQAEWRTQSLGPAKLGKRQVACSQPPATTTTAAGTATPSPSKTPVPNSSKQRVELLSWPGAAPGTVWQYTWQSYQQSGFTTSAHFFHHWQILRRDACGGPVVAGDFKAGYYTIVDAVAGCTSCVKVPLDTFTDKVIDHYIRVVYGVNGQIIYTARDQTGKLVLSYRRKGDMGASASLKVGEYRYFDNGYTSATGWINSFKGRQRA